MRREDDHHPPPAPHRAAPSNPRNVCFVTGTRAEFGLMRPVLTAIEKNPGLRLQLIVTGMHLDPAHGDGLGAIRREGWRVDHVTPWPAGSGRDRFTTARNTGSAMADLADAFARLKTDIVLVVGDRVEAFAAAAAAHVAGVVVAHVHGGDRAVGQIDDSLRHAVSKLAHVHFPATAQSARRLIKLGEDRSRIHRVGSPGLDGIVAAAAPFAQITVSVGDPRRRRYALLVLHPASSDEATEAGRARIVAGALAAAPFERIVVIYPNNDPGSGGIMRVWDDLPEERFIIKRDAPRPMFLGLLRDAAVLVGNSSSGIIEAASFGTPVLDIGPRQSGREHGRNVTHLPYRRKTIDAALARIWNDGRPRRASGANIYGGAGTGKKIADVLAHLPPHERLLRKLIAY